LLAANIEKNRAKLKAVEEQLVQKASNLTKLEGSTSNSMAVNRSNGRRKRPKLESVKTEEAELPDPGSNGGELENVNLGNIAHATPNTPSTVPRFRHSVQPPKNPSKDNSPNVLVSTLLFADCL